jgi:hypothetical protein
MKYIVILSIILLSCISCNKFLDTQPADFIQTDDYYKTESQLNAALAGVYDPLGHQNFYGGNIFYYIGTCSDEGYYPFSQTIGTYVYNFDYSNVYINGLWEQCYLGIERANVLIAHIDNAPVDQVKKNAILGEALFLRGFYHFILVSYYGDVPLKITPSQDVNNVNAARTPSKEVYTQILKDMQSAEEKVYTASALGHSGKVSKTVVQGMLARVCLTMAGYPVNDPSRYAQALAWAKKVQLSGEHALRTSFDAALTNPFNSSFMNNAYSQVFINEAQDVYDVKECMWEADFYSTNGTTFELGLVGSRNGIRNSGGDENVGTVSAGVVSTAKLFRLYRPNDLRRDWAIAPYYYTGAGATLAKVNYAATDVYIRECGKWRREFEKAVPKDKNWTPINFPILRYADVLLMLAEAENEVNGPTTIAYDAFNQVRRRGFGKPITATDPTIDLAAGLSKQAFKDSLIAERSRELCFEGLRRPDLIRWGIFTQTMAATAADAAVSAPSGTVRNRAVLGASNAAASSKFLLLPIPSQELLVNKSMTQNPGW